MCQWWIQDFREGGEKRTTKVTPGPLGKFVKFCQAEKAIIKLANATLGNIYLGKIKKEKPANFAI